MGNIFITHHLKPTRSIVVISGGGEGQDLRLYNGLSQVVKTTKVVGSETKLDVSVLASGTYYIVVIGQDGRSVQILKLVKD